MSEYREATEKNEGRLFLIDLVNQASEAFLHDNPILDRLENGEIDPETWRRFAVQRYLAAVPFESLLEACKAAAESAHDDELVRVVGKNIEDEIGLGEDGEVHAELSHATWRKDFYTALGISDDQLNHAQPTRGTSSYEAALTGLIQGGDPLVMAGALLALEGTIPREFAKMKKGRDITFADAFLEENMDSPELKARKTKARFYLDDHIVHDAKSHYPELLNALEPHAMHAQKRTRIQSGAEAIAKAKVSFYEGWDSAND